MKNLAASAADNTDHSPTMSKVAITLHGQEYIVACSQGEEKKLAELVALVDKKLTEVGARSPNATEIRLFMLACLLLADELVETRKASKNARRADEDLIVAAVNHLRGRVESIINMIDKAAK